ncbi:BcPKS1, polyketide synthase [Clohesyomyces aquaticus]|uniref:BcPKS1, polyketide synthase n=1 Tax=Clohesyomyces aquaticus TaxID=1231657 RepID=A0A1Y1YBR5_9PLEO|nr:BcPKS1, polyketide synthase [Clohesyomyces aquaticus]
MAEIEPIAVVGMSLKFPQGATTPNSLWQILIDKKCTMTEWAEDRINIGSFHNANRSETSSISARGSHFLAEHPAAFDASFFSITANEAASMDPQQRMLLETTFRAFENAGIPLGDLRQSNTGVYVGCMDDDYKLLLVRDIESIPTYAATGAGQSMLANRLSWFFDLHGPSITMDSACSSSLMALDFACQGLRSGDTSMAVVAGVNVLLGCETPISMTRMGFLSPDSLCYSFDERANGYVRGEGVGVIILKRLSDAIASNDTIRAIIRSTGSNSDGYTPGITQPSKESQAKLIRQTYQKARLDLALTRFFEAHGTGTPVGDPIEAAAIGGHLEGASGIAGFIKTVLAVERGIIPPNTNFRQLNPKIPAEIFNLRIPTESIPWPLGIRRASVNSFGFGGSNTHVVVDDAYHFLAFRGLFAHHCTAKTPLSSPQSEIERPVGNTSVVSISGTGSPKLLVWSAADEAALAKITSEFARRYSLTEDGHALMQRDVDDLAYTLSCRRARFTWTSFTIVSTPTDLGQMSTRLSKPMRSQAKTGLLLVFTGQGAQYAKMGLSLLSFPVFKRALEQYGLEISRLGCPWTILDILRADLSISTIDRPSFSQPICTGIQVALVELLRSFNIYPKAVIGHSSGEIAASYACGAISLAAACKIAYHRGRLAESLLGTGTMLAVGLSEGNVHPYLKRVKPSSNENLTISCVNSPKNVTISGTKDQIETLRVHLVADGVFARELKTGVAYHSPSMHAVSEVYATSIGDIEAGSSDQKGITFVSSVSGGTIPHLDRLREATYWVQNMTQSVRFSEAIKTILSQPKRSRKLGQAKTVDIHDILEIGPHSALQRPIQETISALNQNVRYASLLSRFDQTAVTTLNAIGALTCSGYPVHLANVNCLDTSDPSRYKCLVDLPEYPFSRTLSHMDEGSVSNAMRLRQHFPRPLLGAPVPDWNELEPKWRRLLGLRDYPWLADHQVNGMVLFPAAGMVAIALDAAQQLADSEHKISSFFLKEARFSSPIVVPHNEKEMAEVETFARSDPAGELDSKWCDVRITVRVGNGWNEACCARVQIQYCSTVQVSSAGKVQSPVQEWAKERHQKSCDRSTRMVDSKRLYQTFTKMGLQYGPHFQGLRNVRWSGANEAVAEVSSTEIIAQTESEPVLIHPSTFDAVAQLVWVPLTKGGTQIVPTCLPTGIRNAWFSAELYNTTNDTICASTTSAFDGVKQVDASVIVTSRNGEVLIDVDHVEATLVSSGPSESNQTRQRRLCFCMESKPDIDLLEPEQLMNFIGPRYTHDDEASRFYHDHARTLEWFISATLMQLTPSDVDNAAPHIKKYIDWLDFQVRKNPVQNRFWSTTQDRYVDLQDIHDRESFFERFESINARGKLAVETGRKMLSIIRGKLNALEFLFKSGLAEAFYEEVYSVIESRERLSNYLDALGHKNSAMKILEVGAGTGAWTGFVLEPLLLHGNKEEGTPRFSRYDYTDISAGFFEHAKEKFSKVNDTGRMSFQVLDLERNPVEQGFEIGTYDVVVAATVLHATRDLKKTFQHVRKLMKSGAKLIMLEIVQPEKLRSGFTFGLLPGWWLGSDPSIEARRWSPCVTIDEWDDLMVECGFSGMDTVVRDHEDDSSHEMSIVFSTAIEEIPPSLPLPESVLVIDPDYPNQTTLATALQERLVLQFGTVSSISAIGDLTKSTQAASLQFIFLCEIDRPLLRGISEPLFEDLKIIFRKGSAFLWVTKGQPSMDNWADKNMVLGLSRVFRAENLPRRFATLALEPEATLMENLRVISKVLKAVSSSHDTVAIDQEYLVQQGMISIRRISEANFLDNVIRARTVPTESLRTISNAGPVSLVIRSPGVLESICWAEDTAYTKSIGSDEVEIEAVAWGLNSRDTRIAQGQSNEMVFGSEAAGIVRRAGSKTSLNPGDKVVAVGSGLLKTCIRCTEDHVFRIPDDISLDDAASLPMVATAAYCAIVEMGSLQEGERVLIHDGGSAVGQLCIQLARQRGASQIFTTVASQTQRDLVESRYDISCDHIFSTRQNSFVQLVRHSTCGEGVDLVINPLGGEARLASRSLLRPFGRFIDIGTHKQRHNSSLLTNNIEKGLMCVDVNAEDIFTHRPRLGRRALSEVLGLVKEGTIQCPYPRQSFSAGQVEDAFQKLRQEDLCGKVVITAESGVSVKTWMAKKSSLRLSSESTYVIAGGLGGLGRSTARWMVSNGAKYVILLSRSGLSSQQAKDLTNELEAQGVHVATPPCNVSSAEALANVLQECEKSMPSIKGCIQGTMILRDALLENMSYTDWTAAVSSKVETSWNLHTLLPKGMDFFVMLSSLSGITGMIGQSNYAAGNTFQDALAEHRIRNGERAIALDLGIMGNVGIVAENDDYLRQRESGLEMLQVEEEEYHALLDYYCDKDNLTVDSKTSAQALIGLPTQQLLRANGIDIPPSISIPMLSPLAQIDLMASGASKISPTDATQDFSGDFLRAQSEEEAEVVVVQSLAAKLARALSVPVDEIDVTNPLYQYGVDSLFAVELRNWIGKTFLANVPIFTLMGAPSVAAVCNIIATTSTARTKT